MSPTSELTPPLESFSGVPSFLLRFVQVCIRVMPLLLLGSAIVAAIQVGFHSLSPLPQTGIGWQFFSLFLLLLAGWTILIAALNCFVAAAVSVSLGATKTSLGQALPIAGRRLPRVIGYSLLTVCTIFAGLVCLILPGLYLVLRLFPVAQVALFEPNVNVFKRSWELTQHRTLEVFICYIIVLVATFVLSLAIGLTTGLLPSYPGLSFVSSTLLALLTYTIPLVFWVLLYGWFRADLYVPHIAAPGEVYADD